MLCVNSQFSESYLAFGDCTRIGSDHSAPYDMIIDEQLRIIHIYKCAYTESRNMHINSANCFTVFENIPFERLNTLQPS